MVTGEVLIIGAGISGLTLARALHERGRSVRTVDRARKPGGRVATRTVAGQRSDFGPIFMHGADPRFLGWIERFLPAARPGWPARVQGQGKVCDPRSFEAGQLRIAPEAGLNAFPAAIAEGLDLRLETRIDALAVDGDRLVAVAGGERLSADAVVLTVQAPEAQRLVATLPGKEAAALAALLAMVPIVPCLSLVLAYDELPDPGFDVFYPSGSTAVTLIADERGKRPRGAIRTVVVQATPKWSAERVDRPEAEWAKELLAEAIVLWPALAATPIAQHPHRWRHARIHGTPGFAAPILQTLPNGARLGLCGEAFDPRAGLEGAFCSGLALADRLLAEGRS